MFPHLSQKNLPHSRIGFNDDDTRADAKLDHLREPLQDARGRIALAAGDTEQTIEQRIQLAPVGAGGPLGSEHTHPLPRRNSRPSLIEELMIGRTDGVGVDPVTPCQGADAGKLLTGRQIFTQNGQDNLADELLANG